MKKELVVLRYGHREVRDYRVTSHCALVSRALGAKKIIICGEENPTTKKTIERVNKTWGSKFKVEFTKSWKKTVKEYKDKKYLIIHLTMYGLKLNKLQKEIQKKNKIMIIIGSQKVEREVYEIADINIAVSSQPHSEIAALAIMLDRIGNGKELDKKFKNARRLIIPQPKGKKVIDL